MTAHWAVRDGRAIWNGRALQEWVGDLAEQIVACIRPEQVWLYGSVARGDDDGTNSVTGVWSERSCTPGRITSSSNDRVVALPIWTLWA